MIDVLMYLFKNYMGDSAELTQSESDVINDLEGAGFPLNEIHKALCWLDDLCNQEIVSDNCTKTTTVTRVFSVEEQRRISLDARNLVYYLENTGVLTSATRETVIDRVMALDVEEVDVMRLKWVVLLVLFNSPGKEAELAWMEDYVLNGIEGAA